MGLNILIKNANKLSPASRTIIQRFVPFPAVGGFKRGQHSSCCLHRIYLPLTSSCLLNLQPPLTSVTWPWWDTASSPRGSTWWTTVGTWWAPPKWQPDMWALLPQVQKRWQHHFLLSSCVSAPICCHERRIKSDLSRRVHNVLPFIFPRRSWKPPSHVWSCRCPSLCCPPSLCPT